MHDILIPFTLVATVLMLSGLVSGVVRTAPVSVPIVFLGIGLLLGDGALGLLHVGVHDKIVEVVGVLSLAFVLFLDAVNLRFDEGGRAWRVPMLAIGPGTLLTVAVIAVAARLIFQLGVVESLLLGAILASIDPVVLRDVVRDDRVPLAIRQALTIEAGTNDIVVLPLILILSAIALGQTGTTTDVLLLLGRLFLLGPLVGAVVGFLSVWLIETIRKRYPIGREYRALYGVGTVLAAYVAGEAVGGSGFLAVFTAGAVVIVTDFDLCDCFLEYGAVTAEMAMLLAFVIFGALLSSLGGAVPIVPEFLFAAVVLLLARPLAIGLVLRPAHVSTRARLFVGWFGPRGLSSLLFAILVVAQGVPGAETLFAITGLVVLASVVAHGVSATPLIAAYGRAIARETLPEEREESATGLFGGEHEAVPRVTPEELAASLAGPNPPVVLDVRTRSAYRPDDLGIPGSVRVPPGDVPEWSTRQPRDRPIVAYCT